METEVNVKKVIPQTTHGVRSNLIPHVCNQGSGAEISLGGYATSETRGYDDLL